MKSLTLCLATLALLVAPAIVQGQTTTEVKEFRGGNANISVTMSTAAPYGPGAHTAGMGGAYYTAANGAAEVFFNPAGLGFLKRSRLLFDARPGLVLDMDRGILSGVVDLDARISDATDGFIEDIAPEGRRKLIVQELKDQGKLTYPSLAISGGLRGGPGAFALALAFDQTVVGGGIYQLVNSDIDAAFTGFRTVIESREVSDSDTTITRFLATTDAGLGLHAEVNVAGLGGARQIRPDWTAGAAIERFSSHIIANARFQNDGILYTSQVGEEAFNDTTRGWVEPGKQNDLNAFLLSDLESQGWGFRMGTTYRLNNHVALDLFYVHTPQLRFDGELSLSYNTLAALNLGGDEGEEVLDTDKLILSQLTRTKNTTAHGKAVEIHLPRVLTLGVSFKIGPICGALNLTQYFGELSYYYRGIEREAVPPDPSQPNRNDTFKIHDRQYAQGLRLKRGVKLGLNFKYFRLGGGLAAAEEISEGFDRKPKKDLLIPTGFSLGTGFWVGRNIEVSIVLLGVPLNVLKASADYSF